MTSVIPSTAQETVRQYVAALEQGNWTAIAAHPGLSETLQHFPAMLAAFPDLHHTFEQEIVAGEMVCTVVSAYGTHRATFLGIPPTGKPVQFMVLGIDHVVDGKVVQHWALPDWMSLIHQLGASIEPPSVGAKEPQSATSVSSNPQHL
ncbi:MAG: ester cyclase [Roseiflexaceae bacterium]|nr:ester cyclase [Roseiflexaceae bacterium]